VTVTEPVPPTAVHRPRPSAQWVMEVAGDYGDIKVERFYDPTTCSGGAAQMTITQGPAHWTLRVGAEQFAEFLAVIAAAAAWMDDRTPVDHGVSEDGT